MSDFLKGIETNTEVIPEGCLDMIEESRYVVSAIEEDFAELMNESDVVNEASLSEVGDAIVVALQKAWGYIKKLFQDIIDWITEQVKKAKEKKIEKVFAKFDGKSVSGDDVLGKIHAATNIGNVEWMKVFEKGIDAVTSKNADEFTESLPTAISKVLGGKSAEIIDVKTMKEEMNKAFLGDEYEVKASIFDKNKANFKSILLNGGLKEDVKKAYNEARKQIDKAIALAKGKTFTGEVTKAGDEITTNNGEKDKRKNVVKFLKLEAQLLSTGVAVQFKAIQQYHREIFAIVVKAAKLAKVDEADVKESVEIFAW